MEDNSLTVSRALLTWWWYFSRAALAWAISNGSSVSSCIGTMYSNDIHYYRYIHACSKSHDDSIYCLELAQRDHGVYIPSV